MNHRRSRATPHCSRLLILALFWAAGCNNSAPSPGPRPSLGSGSQAEAAARKSDPETFERIDSEVRAVINEANVRYWPLEYDTNEALVDLLDQVQDHLDSGAAEPAKRFLPKLQASEETEHFREVIRRWSVATGRDLRKTVDELKADIANRDPGQKFHPEFHQKFATAFSDLVKIQNEEMRERRNRMIHARLPEVLAPYRQSHPAIVGYFESYLAAPPYNVPTQPMPEGEDSKKP